jgi:integrase
VTANRVLAQLKAALNRAVEDGIIEAGAWRQVRPFRAVEVARTRFLEPAELRRLLNASEPDFRSLLAGAIYTGARYSELTELRVGDLRPEAGECGALHFRKTKSGAARYVYLSDEGQSLFENLTAGQTEQARIFRRSDGRPWKANHQQRRIQESCRIAAIEPPARFHELRHTYASLYLMNGGSLMALTRQLGHADTRMVEKHYGHLADKWRAKEARKHAPRLGTEVGKVRRLRTKRQKHGQTR